ncbi:DUF6443 domain-containing protein [Chryseobacterium sp. PTM-20240506]|uniref:DUF6443 domain-containing protein n=1 Tax=unclassified Chryseobacterium TaxID=2593645 RepID=UPI002359F7FE|nr:MULTISPECIES: DUF6443 domain-containing protein [unclassified Chryseobacterium]MDC8104824.1 RHS repeat-associated core domain-containing protein [Chryseobacterium sp. B21-037]MDQ1805156.1 DUF6443 domain-containing protein [Chryseobacterium sp. CKR4-1]
MKKIIIPIGVLVTGMLQAQLSPTENYVYSKTILDYDANNQPIKTSETVQYFDGLGRPKQVVNIKASPQGKDVVTPIEYDGFGRQIKDYLPIPQGQTLNGGIVSNPLANVINTPYGQEKIYAEKTLENSPLDRLLEQKQVGTAWNDKPVRFEYGTNTATEVKKYVTVTSWASGTTSSAISQSVNYGASQLYKNTITDEDGNKTIEFKNGKGQTILVRKVISPTENADTYYVYNEFDQLAFIIPPKAAVVADVNTVLGSLCYIYRYDGRNRLILKKLPGKDYEFMVYDKQDRLIMTQDAVMGANKQWLFTKYDQFGRVAYTGIYTSTETSGTIGRAAEQVKADAVGSNNVTRTTSVGFIVGGRGAYYTNNASSYPNTITTLLSINYYDTYPVYSFNPTFPTNILGTPVITDSSTSNPVSTKSLPVMSVVKNIEDDNWTSNYTYYDSKGRVVGTHSVNHLGGYTKTETELDFAGTVKQLITRHKRLAADTEKVIVENFTYDPQNRLLTHTHQVNGGVIEYLAQNKYNEISQLESKKVGGVSTTTPLQQVDYKYNIRGWMTKINDPSNLNGKLFGYEVRYNNPVNTLFAISRYNGNIAEVDWKTSVDSVLRRYSYSYDTLNRLNYGHYSEPNSTVPQENHFGESSEYDLNGNITRLYRNTKNTTNGLAMQIDNLTYSYTGNRLSKVAEASQNSSGYPYFATPNEITYDNNGNMTSHKDKGIQNITYNFLNLPTNIKIDKGSGIFTSTSTYLYRADGSKLRKQYNYQQKNPTGGFDVSESSIEYFDGFQYSMESIPGVNCPKCPKPTLDLKFVPTAEGYYDFTNNSYIYNYTDHLGNVRLGYKKGISGIEIIEENNYYPFGLKHEGYNGLAGNPAYQYKYNGKELQTETGMYDYGARMYMPDLGRWGVVDPLAETSRRWSTYVYAYNNPIRFIDPDGMQNKDITFGKNISEETRNKIVSDLEQQTGLKLSVSEDGKLSYKESADAEGSKTARDMLKGAIDNHRTDYQINSDNTRGSSIQEIQGRGETIDGKAGYTQVFDLNINTNQVDNFISGASSALNPLTMGYGMTTLHEVSHMYNGLEDQNVIYGLPGANEKVINTIRTELDATKIFKLPFGQRKSYSPASILLNSKKYNFSPFESGIMDGDFKKIDRKKNLYILTPRN